MDNYPDIIADRYRPMIREQREHRLTPNRQQQLQAEAVAKHEAQQAEAEERIQAIQIRQPQSDARRPSLAEQAHSAARTGRLANVAAKPRQTSTPLTGRIFSEKPKSKRVPGRVALARAQQASHKETSQ